MKKEKLKNKLKNQKGITAADAVIAMLIILTTVGVISMVYVNLTMNTAEIERKAGATRIATNIIENMGQVYYSEIGTKLDLLSDSGIATKVDNTYSIPGATDAKVFETTIPKGYTCEISVENPNPSYDIVKKITVKVSYKVNNMPKEVALSKVVEKEIIRECNSPNFADEYIRQMVGGETDYIMASNTAGSVQPGVKIICPISYHQQIGKYQLVDVSDNPVWYSYSNKNWARVLVLESDAYQTYVDSANQTINDNTILQDSEKSYVWIPRFGVENGQESFGGTYFKYKKTNLPILNSYDENTNQVSDYINPGTAFAWGTRGISFEGDNLVTGKWVSYGSLNTVGTDGYYLNHSQYGPLIQK